MRSPFPLPPHSRNFITNSDSLCVGLPRVPTLTRSSKIRSHGLLAPLILPVSTGSHSSDLRAQGDPVPSGYTVSMAVATRSGWTMRKVYGCINQQLRRRSEITVWYDRLFDDSMLSTRNRLIDVRHCEDISWVWSWSRNMSTLLKMIMENERHVERYEVLNTLFLIDR